MQKGMFYGLLKVKHESQCEKFVLSKQARNSFPIARPRKTTECLQLVHMDLC